ncbi:MAG: dipeptidase [Hyphomicrobiaceae bacterium]
MNRRTLIAAGLLAPFALAGRGAAKATQVPIGDMHFHLFFVGPRTARMQPLAANMARGGATLAGWSLVGDMPWLTIARGGFKQRGEPVSDQACVWLRDELGRMLQHIRGQGLRIVKTAEDVDRALAGEPHVVLSVEGATFADLGPREIETAHALGVRQIQLVHYIRNSLADFQTEKPVLGGLTPAGHEALAACERLGILVDLAHMTDEAARAALAAARAPLIWSHGSVAGKGTPNWRMPVWQARQLRLETARMIADKGGVVGLWALGADVGHSVEGYASRLLQMADWLGEDHVAFGSDMNALAKPALASFADHRRVLDLMSNRKVPTARIAKIAIENYARVLKIALSRTS